MRRKKSVSLIAAVTVGLGVALMSTSPALAQDSRTGYRSCPGGATLVALRSESVGTDYHRIGTTANYWSSSGYHQTYSGYLNRPDFRSYREPCPASAGWADSRSA